MKKKIRARMTIDTDGDKCGLLCRFRVYGIAKGRIGATCAVFDKPVVRKRCIECVRAEKRK